MLLYANHFVVAAERQDPLFCELICELRDRIFEIIVFTCNFVVTIGSDADELKRVNIVM